MQRLATLITKDARGYLGSFVRAKVASILAAGIIPRHGAGGDFILKAVVDHGVQTDDEFFVASRGHRTQAHRGSFRGRRTVGVFHDRMVFTDELRLQRNLDAPSAAGEFFAILVPGHHTRLGTAGLDAHAPGPGRALVELAALGLNHYRWGRVIWMQLVEAEAVETSGVDTACLGVAQSLLPNAHIIHIPMTFIEIAAGAILADSHRAKRVEASILKVNGADIDYRRHLPIQEDFHRLADRIHYKHQVVPLF